MKYYFSVDWFMRTAKVNWDKYIPILKPKKILEIGSYEGMSACYLIEALANEKDVEMHCIDTWEGSIEHIQANIDMEQVEYNFNRNTGIAINNVKNKPLFFKHKGRSADVLVELYSKGLKNYFDFIYIDGSHLPEDVLFDAMLGFKLLKIGGMMAFDDYIWESGTSPINHTPKLAIDSFTTIYFDYIKILQTLNEQILIQKISNLKQI